MDRLRECLGTGSYRRTLCLLPTHFGHGLICNSLFPWLSGRHLFIAPPFSTDLLIELGRLIDQHEITFLSSVPSMWALTLKLSKPPQANTLRRIHCGSAPLSAHLWRQIQDWAGTKEVFNAYGITETGSWVAGTTIGDYPHNEIDEHSSLIESGLIDSLALLQIVTYLEQTYNMDFREMGIDPAELRSVDSILNLIVRELET